MAKVKLKRLRVAFPDEKSFLSEYSENVSQGGIFIGTEEPFELRDKVRIELKLSYCGKVVSLGGEVVHCIPKELAGAGVSPGVAVQFSATARDLRKKFGKLVSQTEPAGDPVGEAKSGAGRRRSVRVQARVPTKITPETGDEIAVQTRDLSRTGLQVSTNTESAIPIGESVKLSLTHPTTGEQMPVDGKVVRHVMADSGSVAAMGIEFEDQDSDSSELTEFVDKIKVAEHSRRLGCIGGPISELGVESTLQMFGGTAPRGTLILRKGNEEGFVAIEEGYMVAAELGSHRGIAALTLLLTWRRGDFEFETRIADGVGDADRCALDFAIDEAKEAGRSGGGVAAPCGEIAKDQIVRATAVALGWERENLSKVEEAVIDLAMAGMSVAKILGVIPEPKEQVLGAIANLHDQQLVTVG